MWRNIHLVRMARKKYIIIVIYLILRRNSRCAYLLLLNARLTQKKRPIYKVCVPRPLSWFRSGGRTKKNTPRRTVTRRVMMRQATCHLPSPSTTMWECLSGHAPTKRPTLWNSERKSYRNSKLWITITDALSSLPNSTHIMSIMYRLLRSNQLLTSSTICGVIIRKGQTLSHTWQTSTFSRL